MIKIFNTDSNRSCMSKQYLQWKYVSFPINQEIDGKPPSKIIGGRNAYDGEFPYQVSLRMTLRHICGGSIIDETHILTAAHCVNGDIPILIRNMFVTTSTNIFGQSKGTSYKIKRVTLHPQYVPTHEASWINDIAILTVQIKWIIKQFSAVNRMFLIVIFSFVSAGISNQIGHSYTTSQAPK